MTTAASSASTTATQLAPPPGIEVVPDVPPFVLLHRSLPECPPPAPTSAKPRTRHLWVVGAVMLLWGALGTWYLAGRLAPDTARRSGLPVSGRGVVVDKPAGWQERQLSESPDLAGSFLADPSGAHPAGLLFTRDGTSIAVLEVPNPAGISALQPFPGRLGELRVSSQAPAVLRIGPARELVANGHLDGRAVSVRATFVLDDEAIYVVAVLAEQRLHAGDVRAYDALRQSLRHH